MFKNIEVIEKPLTVAAGTALKLTAEQAEVREHVLDKKSGGICVAREMLIFKIGETVKVEVDDVPEKIHTSPADKRKQAVATAPATTPADAAVEEAPTVQEEVAFESAPVDSKALD